VDDIIIEVKQGDKIVRFSAKDLVVSDDLVFDAKRNPALEVFWEGLSSSIKYMEAELEIKISEYIAYHKQFLKWFLKGKGEKDTIEARNEAFSLVYAENVTVEDENLAAIFAFKGYCEERKQPLNMDEWNILLQWSSNSNIQVEVRDFNFFRQKMFASKRNSIFYDKLLHEQLMLQDIARTIDAIAKGMIQKGVLLATLISGQRSLMAQKEKIFEKVLSMDENKNLEEV